MRGQQLMSTERGTERIQREYVIVYFGSIDPMVGVAKPRKRCPFIIGSIISSLY